MNLLYAGSARHPSYKFLFEDRKPEGQRSDVALKLSGSHAPEPGHEIVPTERARSLVAYLLSLSTAYDYPEARPVAAPAAASHGAAPAGHDQKTAPAGAAPKHDEKSAAPAGAAPKHDDKSAAPAPKKEEGKK